MKAGRNTNVHTGAAPSTVPVNNLQSLDPAKFAHVARHQRRVMCERRGDDQRVYRADPFTTALQRGAELRRPPAESKAKTSTDARNRSYWDCRCLAFYEPSTPIHTS